MNVALEDFIENQLAALTLQLALALQILMGGFKRHIGDSDGSLRSEALGMTNGSDRLDRIERILEEVGLSLKQVARRQEEMAGREQYHDEAFGRRKAEMKMIRAAIAANTENIQALLAAELRHRRLEDLEGGGAG